MYLMFKPEVFDAIWVPLEKVKWEWSGEASPDENNGFKLDSSSNPAPDIMETSKFPSWDQRIQDKDYEEETNDN